MMVYIVACPMLVLLLSWYKGGFSQGVQVLHLLVSRSEILVVLLAGMNTLLTMLV